MKFTHSAKQIPVLTQEHKEHILKFLREVRVGVLATADPDGNPYGVVIYFSVDEKGNVTFITKRQTKKSSNLMYNDRAMLVVYDPVAQTSAQVMGRVREVASIFESQIIFLNTLQAAKAVSNGKVPPISKLEAGEYVAYRLIPVQLRMAEFSKQHGPKTNGQFFETIDAYQL